MLLKLIGGGWTYVLECTSSFLYVVELQIYIYGLNVSLVPGAREKWKSIWYTLFAHVFNLLKIWGLRAIF